jgi:hypothetical protein
MGKLEALRRAGVEYVIMSFGGSRESLRASRTRSCRRFPMNQ